MQIANQGATRFVILTERYAIKFARVPIIRPVKRLFRMENKGFRERLVVTHVNPYWAVVIYFCYGIIANYQEWRLWKKYPQCDLVPTIFTFLWVVNVQVRGEPATADDVRRFRFHTLVAGSHVEQDVLRYDQMSLLNNRVCLHDYGRTDIEPVLRRFAYMS